MEENKNMENVAIELNEEELEKSAGGNVSMKGQPGARPGLFTRDARSGREFYIVAAGDTLSGIAARYGRDLQFIKAINKANIPNPNLIYPYDLVWMS